MTKIDYSAKITTPYRQMIKMANDVISRDIQKRVKALIVLIDEGLPDVLIQAIESTDVYDSLTKGSGSVNLRAEFGLDNSQDAAAIDEIIRAIVGNINIFAGDIKGTPRGPAGRLRLEAIPRDMAAAFGLSQSFVYSDPHVFSWLDWLSFEGDKILVSDHRILYGDFKPWSRSGKAIMKKSRTGFWKVPPQFSGTSDDNWVTRAVENGNDEINRAITGFLNRVF